MNRALGFIFIPAIAVLTLAIAPAHAQTPSPSPSFRDSYQMSQTDLNNLSCKDFCDKTMDGSAPSQEWCASHGGEAPPGTPTYRGLQVQGMGTNIQDTNCPYKVDVNDGSCDDVMKKLWQCHYRGLSQLYCKAYQATYEANPWEKIVLGLDMTAATSCAAECASGWGAIASMVPGAVASACKATGLAAGAGEIAAAMTIYKHTEAGMAALGIGAEALSFYEAGGDKLFGKAGRLVGIGRQPAGTAPDAKQSQDHRGACVSAFLFTAMSAARYEAMKSNGATRDAACNSIKDLISKDPVAGNTAWHAYTVAAMSPTQAISTRTGATARGTAALPSQPDLHAGLSPQAAASTDGGILNRAGFDRAIPKDIPGFNPDSILKKIDDAGGVGQALSGALAPISAEAASATRNLVAAVEKSPFPIDSSVGDSTMRAGGGSGMNGGAGSGNSKDDPISALSSLFGDKKDQKDGGAGVNALNFRAPASDIWHTGTDLNIFQIVSNRLSQSADRVSQ